MDEYVKKNFRLLETVHDRINELAKEKRFTKGKMLEEMLRVYENYTALMEENELSIRHNLDRVIASQRQTEKDTEILLVLMNTLMSINEVQGVAEEDSPALLDAEKLVELRKRKDIKRNLNSAKYSTKDERS